MTEQVNETKEVVELVFDRAEQYFEAIKQVVEQYSGDAAELGLMAMRIEAINELIIPAVCTGMLLYLFFVVAPRVFPQPNAEKLRMLILKGHSLRTLDEDKLVEKATGRREADDRWLENNPDKPLTAKDDDAFWMLVTARLAVGAFIFLGLTELLDVWSWAGIIKPELYAVHKLLLK